MIELLQDEIPPVTTPDEQRIVNAYHRLFQGKDWETVKSDLLRKFSANKPSFARENGDFNPYCAAMHSGSSRVLIHIGTRLLQTVQNEPNIVPLIVRK